MALVRHCSSMEIKLVSDEPDDEAEVLAPLVDKGSGGALAVSQKNCVLRRSQACRQRSSATQRWMVPGRVANEPG